jgi:hypothetical protein
MNTERDKSPVRDYDAAIKANLAAIDAAILERQYRPGGEVRVTSATGGQKGQKDMRLGGADPWAMDELARIYGFGEQKYDRFNYLKGYDWSLSIDALKRHLSAFERREDRDEESGLLHTAHVAWHGLALTSFVLREVGTDDRAPLWVPGGTDPRR